MICHSSSDSSVQHNVITLQPGSQSYVYQPVLPYYTKVYLHLKKHIKLTEKSLLFYPFPAAAGLVLALPGDKMKYTRKRMKHTRYKGSSWMGSCPVEWRKALHNPNEQDAVISVTTRAAR
jgi:hypothetical protein